MRHEAFDPLYRGEPADRRRLVIAFGGSVVGSALIAWGAHLLFSAQELRMQAKAGFQQADAAYRMDSARTSSAQTRLDEACAEMSALPPDAPEFMLRDRDFACATEIVPLPPVTR